MNDTLANLAQQHLGIHTLQARNSPRLDHREVAVWDLRAALEAAYRAGQEAARKG